MRAALTRRVQRLERQTAAEEVAPWWATPLAWALLYDETVPRWQAEAKFRSCRWALEQCGLADDYAVPLTDQLRAAFEAEYARVYPLWELASDAYAGADGGLWSAERASDEYQAEREVSARHPGQAVQGRGVPAAVRLEVEQAFRTRLEARLARHGGADLAAAQCRDQAADAATPASRAAAEPR
jgi:hypothetical protein